jgi:hypothetical protein
MIGPIEAFMTEDHVRLDALLRASKGDDDAYRAFRGGLLRHIGMEEKVLLPFARERTGAPLVIAAQLRTDHSRIARLLVQTPTRALVDELCAVLEAHNAIEEGPDGLYATCDALAADGASAIILMRLRAQPEVPLAKYYDGPLVRRVK